MVANIRMMTNTQNHGIHERIASPH